jgi:hypothetical protein
VQQGYWNTKICLIKPKEEKHWRKGKIISSEANRK